jgi:hypothetical protein
LRLLFARQAKGKRKLVLWRYYDSYTMQSPIFRVALGGLFALATIRPAYWQVRPEAESLAQLGTGLHFGRTMGAAFWIPIARSCAILGGDNAGLRAQHQ